jgi:hypothetical protein
MREPVAPMSWWGSSRSLYRIGFVWKIAKKMFEVVRSTLFLSGFAQGESKSLLAQTVRHEQTHPPATGGED